MKMSEKELKIIQEEMNDHLKALATKLDKIDRNWFIEEMSKVLINLAGGY